AVTVQGERVTWTVDVGLPALRKVVALPDDASGLDEQSLQSHADGIARRLAADLTLVADGEELPLVARGLEAVWEEALPSGTAVLARVKQTFVAQAPAPISSLRLGVRLFAELTSEHRALVTVRLGGREEQHILL